MTKVASIKVYPTHDPVYPAYPPPPNCDTIALHDHSTNLDADRFFIGEDDFVVGGCYPSPLCQHRGRLFPVTCPFSATFRSPSAPQRGDLSVMETTEHAVIFAVLGVSTSYSSYKMRLWTPTPTSGSPSLGWHH